MHMPTGTGKTGVIAVVCCSLGVPKHCLILTPWRALQRQMVDDLAHKFWKTMKQEPSAWARPIVGFSPSELLRALDHFGKQPGIMVGTFQGLRWLYERDKRGYEALRRSLSLVAVDEGHYEPAPEWGNAVRHLSCPTILFTATPYRNDLKFFRIDPEYISSFSFRQAIQHRYIRDLAFREISVKSPGAFVDGLLQYFHGEFQKARTNISSTPKVIVRCQNVEDVKAVASLIKARGESVVAIHENFGQPGEHDYCVRTVPDPRKNPYTFWVHQFKLMEGVDESDFEVLALYQPFRNARAFIQQVGRIIRNPGRKPGQKAFVLSDRSSRQEEYWKNYLNFEKSAEEPGYLGSLLEVPPHKKLFDAQQGIWYISGNFRSVLNPNAPNIERELLFRPSTLVLRTSQIFDFRALCNDAIRLAKQHDRETVGLAQPAENTWLYAYVDFENSPLLHSKVFIECRLGYTFFRRINGLLFCYDSQGLFPDVLAESTLAVDPLAFQRLFPQGDKTRFFEVSLVNTDLGRHAVRARTIRARSIADTAPSIADYAHFCSTVTGYAQLSAKKGVRRYLGITRGRVTDQHLPLRFEDYMRWLDSLAAQMKNGSISSVDLFTRYAQFADVPEKPEPRNILLDIADVMANYVTFPTKDHGPATMECDDLCFQVKKGRFTFIANGRRMAVAVRFDESVNRYILNSPGLGMNFYDAVNGKPLLTHLNQTQSFRVVPKTPRYIYAHGHWFLPNLNVARTSERLLKLFRPVGILSSISTEKGRECGSRVGGWEERSLFGLIDRLGAHSEIAADMAGVDILVCDDMGKEAADFIAADTRKRHVIFIHAKAFAVPRKRSASSFQEVCGQAVKNLELLHPYTGMVPPNIDIWSEPWSAPGVVGEGLKRIRLGPTDPQVLWKTVQELISDPTTVRSVWIILGQGFSHGEFQERAGKNRGRPEDVQIIYQVQSTWNAVASIGAQLQIFCSA